MPSEAVTTVSLLSLKPQHRWLRWLPLLLASWSCAAGDILQGIVVDSGSGVPLYRVKVAIDTAHATYTDREGGFSLTTDGSTHILTPGFRRTPLRYDPGSDYLNLRGRRAGFFAAQGFFAADGRRLAPLLSAIGSRGAALDFASEPGSSGLSKGSASSAAAILTFERAGFKKAVETVSGSRTDLKVKMQPAPVDTTPGLHPFLYVGEWQNATFANQSMYIVKGGKIDWSYTMPANGELGDATLCSNGNIVFSRLKGVSVITPDKRVIWNFDAPAGTEIHAAKPLGLDRILYVQNGVPPYVKIVNMKTGLIEKQIALPAGKPNTPHLQFRRVSLTKQGTILAAHSDWSKVAEYDTATGKEIWSAAVPNIWTAVRLKNGNTLVTGKDAGSGFVRELDKQSKIVWELVQKDVPNYKLYLTQEASRLENGNTVVCNFVGFSNLPDNSKTFQVLEVTPDKRVIWAMKAWKDPFNLGPASAIQLLDEPGIPENGDLQR